jgi:hypothetical protein
MIRLSTAIVAAVVIAGCGTSAPRRTGFLGDYTKLTEASATSFRYVAPAETSKRYTRFIVEPVKTYDHGEGGREVELGALAEYFRAKLVEALTPEYPVVSEAGPGVGRVRVAITDVKAPTWYLNLYPASKLTGAGLGEAGMELEVVDSVTGEQVAALVEMQSGSRLELDTFSKNDDAKDAIDDWCARFRAKLDEIHGVRAK